MQKLLFVVLVILASLLPLASTVTVLADIGDPEISDTECSFWLDHDRDGEGDEPFNIDPGYFVLQTTSVVGGCTFRLNTPEQATMLVESDLHDWKASVELRREPSDSQEFQMYPGRTRLLDIEGSMKVTVNFSGGDTPRSVRSRALPDGYSHEVQIPETFRLLGVTVTTPDGRKARLEQNSRSASGAFINTNQRLQDLESELPEWAVQLAEKWLESGYPQVSEDVLETVSGSADDDTSTQSVWMVAFAFLIVLVLVLLVPSILYVRERRGHGPTPPVDPNL